MEVIEHHDPTGQMMVARYPRTGTSAIRLGSQLIVEESQQAVFFRDGKALDTPPMPPTGSSTKRKASTGEDPAP